MKARAHALAGALAVALACPGVPATASAGARRAQSGPHPDPGPITDPNDAAFMDPPNGQLRTWSDGKPEKLTRGFSSRRRIALTLLPAYAGIRLPLLGRASSGCSGALACPVVRGVGASAELDVRVLRWLWLRLGAAHTVHPVDDEFFFDEEDDELRQVARKGTLGATTFGLSGVYPIDLGRFLPLLDVGAGALVLTSPDAAVSGQMGGQCRDDGTCDAGLSCSADEVCRPTLVPEVHVGVGLDVLLGRHWSVGAQIRYYALLSSISVFPSYLMGALRLTARF